VCIATRVSQSLSSSARRANKNPERQGYVGPLGGSGFARLAWSAPDCLPCLQSQGATGGVADATGGVADATGGVAEERNQRIT